MKVAIVTAASRGIGEGCARALARAGWSLVLMSRSDANSHLAKELGGIAVKGDVTETKDLEKVVKTALDKHGRIDGVVNNTGHGPRVMRDSMRFSYSPDSTAELLEIGDDEWHHGVDMYILNVVRMARLVTPVMLKQGKGAIVNISSMAAFQPRAAYPLSVLRTTTQGFVKLYSDKYGKHGIRMNNLSPGWMENVENVVDADRRAVPMARAGTMAEIGATAAFLLSDDAGYITGQDILADGGMNRALV